MAAMFAHQGSQACGGHLRAIMTAPELRRRVRMGPLDGIKVVEIASLAPAPFGCMILSDLGADVVRVDRADQCDGAAAPPDPQGSGARPRLDQCARWNGLSPFTVTR